MCGIFGVLWHDKESIPDARRLEQTARLLQHRGPDNTGVYADVGVGLVHTRLSLLDLGPRSNQPFWDRQKRYCLLYNGEIYNFKELRAELEQCAIQFRTTSDTEVLLEWLINRGVEATIAKLEGMFAFALYDSAEKSFVLARDRFGIKPLFIYDEDDTFVFASEIAAMRPWVKFNPDLLSISSFLQGFSGPTRGYTFFEKIKFLDPGGTVKIRRGERARYNRLFAVDDLWRPEETEELKRLKPGKLVDRLDELLHKSVKSQLFADAPVGALCSGGLDSSILMALASKYHNDLTIFHANVVGPLSEYEAAAQLAKHLKLDLKVIDVHDQDFIDQMPDVIEHYSHPFYPNAHSAPFLMVSRLVQRYNVKAILSGEGADECYLGYSWLAPTNIQKWLNFRKMAIKSMKITTKESADPIKSRYWGPGIVGGSHGDTQAELMTALHNRFEVANETMESRSRVFGANMMRGDYSVLKSLDLLNYNLRSLLHRNDSMGMAASIESRFPFLDTELVKLALNMPYKYKIRFSPLSFDKNHVFFRDKWILRKVGDRYLPRALSQREKKPFPINAYSPRRMQISPRFFENSHISELFGLSWHQTKYLTEKATHDLKLKLTQLEVWCHVCLNDFPKEAIKRRLMDHVSVISS
jgi:asparagine synthase (glutamine-hydrolysing)